MDRFDDDTLFAELRELRPTPRPEFTAKLDERAAAGFPRRTTPYTSPVAMFVDWWRDLSLRSQLIPVAGVALIAVVVATAVIATSGGGGNGAAEDASLGMATSEPSVESTGGGREFGGAGGGAAKGPGHGGHPHSESSGETVYEVEAAPSITRGPNEEAEAGGEEAGAEYGAEAESAGGVNAGGSESSSNAKAEGVESRDIERSSYIVLGTKPGEVSAASAKVFDAVHTADGIVLRSSVQSGSRGATGATFALLIPSGKVNNALA